MRVLRMAAKALGVAVLFVAGGALTIWAAGDRFFEVSGAVTDCATNEPIPSVSVHADLLRGFGEEPLVLETDNDGRFDLLLNEPPNSAAKLTLTHPSYRTLAKVLDPAPPHDEFIRWCLDANRSGRD